MPDFWDPLKTVKVLSSKGYPVVRARNSPTRFHEEPVNFTGPRQSRETPMFVQIWAVDIAHIPMASDFVHLAAVVERDSRRPGLARVDHTRYRVAAFYIDANLRSSTLINFVTSPASILSGSQ